MNQFQTAAFVNIRLLHLKKYNGVGYSKHALLVTNKSKLHEVQLLIVSFGKALFAISFACITFLYDNLMFQLICSIVVYDAWKCKHVLNILLSENQDVLSWTNAQYSHSTKKLAIKRFLHNYIHTTMIQIRSWCSRHKIKRIYLVLCLPYKTRYAALTEHKQAMFKDNDKGCGILFTV